MTIAPTTVKRRSRTRRWVRRGFLLWAIFSMAWVVNSMRTRGVPDELMRSGNGVSVVDGATTLEFLPAASSKTVGLIFLCGSGVDARAYAPLLRPIADSGYSVFIVKLPYDFAPLDSHKAEAVARARRVIAAHSDIARWVLSGHSLGGALAVRAVQTDRSQISALVLIGTTHPKEADLSSLPLPVTKVYATNDGVAPADRVVANKRLLPANTRYVVIEGGNHSQFGHYGHQLFDGSATISREAQQAITRSALVDALTAVAK